jgi:diguanylate cyclase (GGDEF)-like protein
MQSHATEPALARPQIASSSASTSRLASAAEAREGAALGALLVLDLDGLHEVNERHGRLAGDRVLDVVAKEIATLVRAGDVIARSNGDEFVILARGVGLPQATGLAQRLRRAIAALPLSAGGRHVGITASIGVAAAHESFGREPLASLIALAKERLGAAKRAGKNRVCASDAEHVR